MAMYCAQAKIAPPGGSRSQTKSTATSWSHEVALVVGISTPWLPWGPDTSLLPPPRQWQLPPTTGQFQPVTASSSHFRLR